MAEFIKKIISSSLAVILVLVAFASCSDRQGTETGALEGSVDSTEPALTTPDIKRNRFKERIRTIAKITSICL